MTKAAFLDRDGVINKKAPEGEYITRWEEVEFLPGVARSIALLNQAGFFVIVVSNQRCVAKGLVTVAEVEALHRRMWDELAHVGARIDAAYYCPHDTHPACRCRKPKPGMLLDAARDHEIELAASWMIGDTDADVEAGRTAGVNTVRLLQDGECVRTRADIVASSLLEAVPKIL
jgi:D-glycero-D-manno-heptose 1,7-bisphosphate phosphatase